MPVQTGDQLTIEIAAPGGTQTVTVAAGGAAAAAVVVPVTALTAALPQGAVLTFNGNKTVTTTAPAAAGAVSIATTAVPVGGLAAGNSATGPSIPSAWFPLNDMNRFSRRNTRGTTRTRVFMRARPYLTRGQRETTATISGLLNTDDTGQGMARSAMNTDSTVMLRILPDGVNGFMQEFYVNNTGNDASPDPADLQDASFELSDAGDPYAIGTGPVL